MYMILWEKGVMKQSWAGHLGRVKNGRRTKKSTEWALRTKRVRGRPARRWQDDIVKAASVT